VFCENDNVAVENRRVE